MIVLKAGNCQLEKTLVSKVIQCTPVLSTKELQKMDQPNAGICFPVVMHSPDLALYTIFCLPNMKLPAKTIQCNKGEDTIMESNNQMNSQKAFDINHTARVLILLSADTSLLSNTYTDMNKYI